MFQHVFFAAAITAALAPDGNRRCRAAMSGAHQESLQDDLFARAACSC
jgi:hypothetical protein